MNKLIGALCALVASVAFGATTVPIQLLNPSGSSSGQAVVSTGASSAPVWGGQSASYLTGVTQYNVAVGGSTGLAFIGPGTSGNIFASNGPSAYPSFQTPSALGLAQLSGATFTGAITPSQTAGIVGTTTNNNANAGSIGEFNSTSGSGVSLTSQISANIVSVSLGAGDWDVWGNVEFDPAGSTVTNQIVSGLSTTSATLPNSPSKCINSATQATGQASTCQPIPTRFSFSTTTTVYLVGNASFSTSTMTASGVIAYRRRR